MKSIVLTLIVLLLSSTTVVAADPTVSISPSKSKVAVGGIASVDIVMQNFPVNEGGGVTLRFNPDVVKVTGVTVNTQLGNFANSAGTIDNTKGEVSDIWFSTFTGASGDATIATVELQAVKTGRTRLRLSESSLNPFASGGERLSVEFERGIIRVSRQRHHRVSRH